MSAVTFAIAWALSRDFVAATIIGATGVEQLDDTLKAAGVVLPAEALAKVDSLTRELMYPMG
jgi:aryl-alcohol dehydrogenase-like predicted oxidoreductase